VLVAAGVVPMPRVARGALALLAGLGPLMRLLGELGQFTPLSRRIVGALALTLLPGALLTRAKNPISKLARLIALAGAVFVVLYLVPQARALIAGWKVEVTPELVAGAGSLAGLALLSVMGLLALVPGRTVGGAAMWASLMLLWLPVGSLIQGWWAHSFASGLAGGVMVLACAMGAALGTADLAGGDITNIEK